MNPKAKRTALRPQEPDVYTVLGIAPGASQAEIHAALRRLAKAYHPDRNRNPEYRTRFQMILAAYEKVKTPHARAQYDASLRKQSNDNLANPAKRWYVSLIETLETVFWPLGR